MVKHAYLNADRTQCVSARWALTANHSRRYFCPNPYCDAHLYICQSDGNRQGYFSANRKLHRHIEHCDYSSGDNSAREQYDESKFDFHKVMAKLITRDPYHPSKQTEDKPNAVKTGNTVSRKQLTTVRQLYTLCKQNPPMEQFNNYKFGNMLFDERSKDMHPNGPIKEMLVEAVKRRWFFDSEECTIFLKTATTRSYKLEIHVPDRRTYYQFKKTIFDNPDSKIVLAGTWSLSRDGAYSSLTVEKKSQYWFCVN